MTACVTNVHYVKLSIKLFVWLIKMFYLTARTRNLFFTWFAHTYVYSQGGESTAEEMCLSFIYYYPEASFTYCTSAPDTDQYVDWARKYAP